MGEGPRSDRPESSAPPESSPPCGGPRRPLPPPDSPSCKSRLASRASRPLRPSRSTSSSGGTRGGDVSSLPRKFEFSPSEYRLVTQHSKDLIAAPILPSAMDRLAYDIVIVGGGAAGPPAALPAPGTSPAPRIAIV